MKGSKTPESDAKGLHSENPIADNLNPKDITEVNSTPTTEKLFHLMIEEVSDYATLLLDTEGNILNWNRGAEIIKGYKAEEVLGRNFSIFYSFEDRENGLPTLLLEEAQRNGRAVHDGWRVKKDGSKFWGAVIITALHGEDGSVIGFSKFMRDLSERKAGEEKQQRVIRDLEHKNEVLQRSEELYHNMVAEVEDYAIILLDVDGKILNWNKGAKNIKGYKAEEIIGQNFSIFYLQDDVSDGLPAKLMNLAKEHGKANHEGWRVKSDGTAFWGSITLTALHDTEGNVTGYSKVTRDLTERMNVEERQQRYLADLKSQNEKLRASEERYHRMIAEVEDYAIILLDNEGTILNWNKGAEKIKGYKDNEIIGKNFRKFYLPEDREKGLPEQLLSTAMNDNSATHEGWRLRKDGRRFWGSVVITALHDIDGNVTGFSKVTRDLTQKKEAEDLILLQNRQLEEFAYVASHDLQEPLRKIMLFSDLLERNIDNEEAIRQHLSKINNSSERMTKLIKAVLDYSRSKNFDPLIERVDLNAIFQDIQTDFEMLFQDRNVKMTFSKLPTLKGVPIQMHQLFSNLVSNAIKFNENFPEITVTSQTVKVNQELFTKISVADNGIGFNPDYAEKIFQLFHRLEGRNAGTGIGLALCRRIAEGHGGKIKASAIPGQGSVFEVLLPLS